MDRSRLPGNAASQLASRNPLICIVDDDGVYRKYLRLLLERNSCRVLEADCGDRLIDIVERQQVDCILLDYNLATENGLSVHQQIKDRVRDVPPIVMLTGEANERTIIKAFRGGITDCVMKGNLQSGELFGAVVDALARRDDRAAERDELARLRGKSDVDDSTGLYRREHMQARLSSLAKNRPRGRYAIILIAPAELSAISEKFGQVTSDRCKRAFVVKLKATVRATDTCGHYDESRFMYLVDVDVTQKIIAAICTRLRYELSFQANIDGLPLQITPMIGSAICPFDGSSHQDVLARAEHALAECGAAAAPFVTASAPPSPAPAANASPIEHEHESDARGRGVKSETPNSGTAGALGVGDVNRRTVRRQRVLQRGKIFIPDLPSAVECIIRDISPKGARLRVDRYFAAPERFELLLNGTSDRKRVILCWRIGNELGVQFVDADLRNER